MKITYDAQADALYIELRPLAQVAQFARNRSDF